MDNPLLAAASVSSLPAFDHIRPEHAEPAIDAVLAQNRAELQQLLAQPRAGFGWETLIEPLEEMSDRLARAWGPVAHLFAVTSTPEWRKAYNACLPKVTEYGLELAQNEALFRAYESLQQQPGFGAAAPARRKLVADALRDFRLSGIALPEQQKARFKQIALRLSELQTRFEENLLDGVQAYSRPVADESLLVGMTEQGKAQAAQRARDKNLEGFLLTLDFPSYDAVISYADNRELRLELYTAYATRASDQGPLAGR